MQYLWECGGLSVGAFQDCVPDSQCGQSVRTPADCEEGRGFSPDYWVDSPDEEAETAAWVTEYGG